jgi:hypothetical protein
LLEGEGGRYFCTDAAALPELLDELAHESRH